MVPNDLVNPYIYIYINLDLKTVLGIDQKWFWLWQLGNLCLSIMIRNAFICSNQRFQYTISPQTHFTHKSCTALLWFVCKNYITIRQVRHKLWENDFRHDFSLTRVSGRYPVLQQWIRADFEPLLKWSITKNIEEHRNFVSTVRFWPQINMLGNRP